MVETQAERNLRLIREAEQRRRQREQGLPTSPSLIASVVRPTPTTPQVAEARQAMQQGSLSPVEFKQYATKAQPKPVQQPIQDVRAAPTIATPQNPVVSISEPKPEKPEFSTLDDTGKMTSIGLKQYRGEDLTDEEVSYLIQKQLNQPAITDPYASVKDVYTKQAQEAEDRLKQRESELTTSREKMLETYGQQGKSQLEQDIARTREAGQRESQAVQSALSFSGFGRSTYNADKQAIISREVSDRELALTQAFNLEQQAYKRQLEGADEEELSKIRGEINSIRQNAADLELQSALKTAELNQQNQVDGLDAINNILKSLGTKTKSKIDKTVSEMLGYVSDEMGNPVLKDESGNPIPVQKTADETKYERFEGKDGKIYFYNPKDPAGTMMASQGNGVFAFTDEQGKIKSSQSTDTKGVQDAEDFVRQNYGEDFAKWKANCAEFVRKFVPNMPGGNYNKSARVKNIEIAKKGGYGSDDMSQVQVGDAIMTGEGSVGHSAMVIGKEGNMLTLLEANYQNGKITYGRTIDLNDSLIYGWVRPDGTSVEVPTELATPSMDNQLRSGMDDRVLTAADKAMAAKIAKDELGSSSEENVRNVENMKMEGMDWPEIKEFLGGTEEQGMGTGVYSDFFTKGKQMGMNEEDAKKFANDRVKDTFATMTEAQGKSFQAYSIAQKETKLYDRISSGIDVEKFANKLSFLSRKIKDPESPLTAELINRYIDDTVMRRAIMSEMRWLNAILREESGAAITVAEYLDKGNAFFPRAGDDADSIKDKEEARKVSEEALYNKMGPSGQRSYKETMESLGFSSSPENESFVTPQRDAEMEELWKKPLTP